MNKREPTRAWFAIFNLTSIGLAFFLTNISLFLSGIYNEPGYSDGVVSSPFEFAFLIVAVLAPIGVVVGVIMSQWKRSIPWAVFGVLISLSPVLLIAIVLGINFISQVLLAGI